MNKDDAKQRIDDLLARISNCGDNYFAVFQEMSKVLTTDGIGRLLVMLKANLSDEFLKDNNIQYLFKGMPIFKIVVKEDDFVRSKTDGKYDIILQHSGTGARELIKFETRPSKALYLLFLLMPRKEIKQIKLYRETLQELLNFVFDIVEKDDKTHKLDDKFKDDELSNILVGANKEISAKINERKLTIQKDTDAMNKLVSDAEDIKKELIKLNAEKKALEILLNKSMDISKFYESTLSDIIAYSNENPDNLCGYFKQDKTKASQKHTNVKKNNKRISDKVTSEAFDLDSIISNDIVKN
jgi:hypothetical protein